MEVNFDKFLIMIGENTNEDLEKISTFRFFVLIEYLKEKQRNKNKHGRSNS